ncbi:core protein [Halomonas citrativorans]|uniref:Core protein n=2 Tax=Halomonas citrativorans TaxID=2742612 RepID=A0A1R4I1G5_9GAMM|nr:core protein [Halomonas citrativorans]
MIERQQPDGERLTLGYDGANRLVSLTHTRAYGHTTEAAYRYDGLGRRINKTVRHTNGTTATTHFGWDGDRIVREESDSQRSTIVYELGSFVPMLRIDDTQQGQILSAFVTDALGTPMQLVAVNGDTKWQAQPDDWAAVKHQRGNTAQPIRFQGQWHDEESGLYYNRHRYYDPQQGRYISQDPIGLNGGTNLYGYVANPTGAVDPLGLVGQVCAIPGPTMAACASAAQWLAGLGMAVTTAAVAVIFGHNSSAQDADQIANVRRSAADISELNERNSSQTYFHYTNEENLSSIMSSGVIRADSRNRVFMTTEGNYSPEVAQQALFMGRRGQSATHMMSFQLRDGVQLLPGTQPNELIHNGSLRIGRQIKSVTYAGPNLN